MYRFIDSFYSSAPMTNNNPITVTGDIIRRLRQLKGIKQITAAERLGVTQQAYSKLECAGAVSMAKIPAILQALDSRFSELEQLSKFYPPQ